MAVFNKFQDFVERLGQGVHDFRSTGHVIKVYLSNTTPNAATMAVKADLAEIAAGNGYTAGGASISNNWSESGGTATMTGTDVVWTASGGTIGPFRYVVLYNSTATNQPLIGWWDYGSSITLQAGETFTVDFGASILSLS